MGRCFKISTIEPFAFFMSILFLRIQQLRISFIGILDFWNTRNFILPLPISAVKDRDFANKGLSVSIATRIKYPVGADEILVT